MEDHGPENKFLGADAHYSQGIDLEAGFRRARLLAARGDSEGCLNVLAQLEEKYVQGAQIFDLYGEVLIRQGNLLDGIRYKTVYTVLKGIFRSVNDVAAWPLRHDPEGSAVTRQESAESIEERRWEAAPRYEQGRKSEESDLSPTTVVPVTLAMGNEFMRQGHFDLALGIFDRLMDEHPQDESLRDLRVTAAKRNREKRLLAILQRWLKNIEQMKTVYEIE